MTEDEKWIRGLLALFGAGFSAWLAGEARKAREQNWRENNLPGLFVSAGVQSAAHAGFALSLREIFRLLDLAQPNPYLSRKKRSPLFLPDYEQYPV